VVDDILEVGDGALQLPSVDGLGGLTGVLEADTQVRAPRAGALRGRNRLCGVADLFPALSVYSDTVSNELFLLGWHLKGEEKTSQ
jgi:hypothetical protein